MSAIFISHSSHDRAAAAELRQHLSAKRYESVFLDFDPEAGIPAGRSWEAELYQRLRICRALIALCSEHSLKSRWCFAEITQARALGKPVFPIRIGPGDVDSVIADRQIIDLTAEPVAGYERLWRGLELAGLDPGVNPDPKRPPYPGLQAFEEADAGYFFGRDDEIGHISEFLERMRRFGEPRLAVVLGASGSGKSSLVRAGVVPRLRRDRERWVIVPPFRPGERPLDAVANALADAFAATTDQPGWRALRGEIGQGTALRDLVRGLRTESRRDASVLLILDQLEELLGPQRTDEAAAFMAWLCASLADRDSSVLALATLRSDFFAAFQRHEIIGGSAFGTLPIGPLSAEALPQVIEGPAALCGLDFEPGLVPKIVQDAGSSDALPLLAFVLRELFELREDHVITRALYEDRLKGMSGAIERTARDIVPPHVLASESGEALRTAFLRMVTVDEDGQFARRRARWSDLPEASQPLLRRFVDARLLVTRGDEANREVEVAHEALFHAWPQLAKWLDEERGFLLWRRRVQENRRDWELHERDAGSLLHGAALVEARSWLSAHEERLEPADLDFVRASLRAAHRQKRRRWLGRAGVGIVVLVASLLAVAAIILQRRRLEDRQIALGRDLAIKAELIRDRDADALQLRALLATEAARRMDSVGVRSAEVDLALRRALDLLPQQLFDWPLDRRADAVAFGTDGTKLIVALSGSRAVVELDRATGAELNRFVLPGEMGRANAVDLTDDGRFLVTALEGTNLDPAGIAQVWNVESETAITSFPFEGRISQLALSHDGRFLALGVVGEPISILEVVNARLVGTLDAGVTRVEFASNGLHLAGTGRSGGVWMLREGPDGVQLLEARGFPAAFYRNVAFSPDGAFLALVNRDDRSYQLWRVEDAERVARIPLDDAAAGTGPMALSDGGRYVAYLEPGPPGSRESDIVIQPLVPGLDVVRIPAGVRTSTATTGRQLSFARGGFDLAVTRVEGPGMIGWRLTSGTSIAEMHAGSRVVGLHFLAPADGNGLAVVAFSETDPDMRYLPLTLRVLDVPAGNLRPALSREIDAWGWALSADGTHFAVAPVDGNAEIWNVATGDREASFSYAGVPQLVAVSPDGRRLVLATTDAAFLFAVPDSFITEVPFEGRPTEVAFGDNGPVLRTRRSVLEAAGTRGESTRNLDEWYDLVSGDRIDDGDESPALGNPEPDRRAFTAGATASDAATVWHANGVEIARVEDRQFGIDLTAVSADGRYLATSAAGQGIVRFWPLEYHELIQIACSRLARTLTSEEWRRYLPQEEYAPACAAGKPG